MTATEKSLVSPPTGEHRGLTNLEIGHMVLQQSLSIADVLFSSHEHKGNHALIKHKQGEMKNLVSFFNKADNSHLIQSPTVGEISLTWKQLRPYSKITFQMTNY